MTTLHARAPFARAEDLLAAPRDNRLFIDVRLGDPATELESYRDGHIHGAVHAQIRDVFAGPPTAATGNLPLPDPVSLALVLEAWGVDEDTEIVLYGPNLALAARAWWVLRWAGLSRVLVLDGGLKAWTAAGGAVARGDAVPSRRIPGRLPRLSAGALPEVGVAELASTPPATIVDARDAASYQAGHLPGAIHLAAAEHWTPSGLMRSREILATRYAEAGLRPGGDIAVYCGGGVLSALVWMTMVEAGLSPRLYVGSWSEWSRDPARLAQSETGIGKTGATA
ncbi:sulfurtransferase [Cupriavidus pauculus]|nr:rhodanese-like domain-containing protein [Cupriavidus pauculus]